MFRRRSPSPTHKKGSKSPSFPPAMYTVGDVVVCTVQTSALRSVFGGGTSGTHRCGVVFVLPAGQTQLPSWMQKEGAKPQPHQPQDHARYLVRSLTLRNSHCSGNESGFFLPKHFHAWVGEGSLAKADVELNTTFGLVELPLPVLGLVLRHLPLAEAALQSLTCRRFAAAFRDEAVWKQRCIDESKRLSLPMHFTDSYFISYRKHFVWHIDIVTLFTHRGGRSISGRFTVAVAPNMSVEDFERVVRAHPDNRQRSTTTLKPHNPSVLGGWNQPLDPNIKPNCSYNDKDPKATLSEAGLCNGAILEQPERMMRD